MNVCGIDVSKNTLDVVCVVDNKALKAKSFVNNSAGHKALLKHLNKLKVNYVGLEATGNYHLDVALMLVAHDEINLMVINPKAANNFARAMLTKLKTDAMDAYVLAQYVLRMEFKPWCAPANEFFAVRACGRRLSQLVKIQTKFKNQLHSHQSTQFTPDFVIQDTQQSITHLEKQIEQLITHTRELIDSHQATKKMYEQLTAIDYLGVRTAIKLIGELGVLDGEMKPKQLVAHAGMYPTFKTSGTSVNKKSKLSKCGNKYIREALYMPAMQMCQKSQHINAFYQHLTGDNGLTNLQAICAVMRKLLMAISCVIRNQSTFDPSMFYRLQH